MSMRRGDLSVEGADRGPSARLSIPQALGAFRYRSEGVAAVEFALIVPFFIFALLAMIDTGMMVSEKLAVDQILRSGAQIAMTDPGAQAVYDAIVATGSPQFQIVASPQAATADQLSVGVTRFYACSETPDIAVPADTNCDAANPTAAFYQAVATKPYDEIIVPNLVVNAAFLVQVR